MQQFGRHLAIAAALAASVLVPNVAGAGDAPPAGSTPTSPTARGENWRSSPYHGVIDGAGQVIPCRCRFNGQEYRLGEMVCMNTHLGTVMTRCDLFLNNTSWVPTSEPCTTSRAPGEPKATELAAR